MSARTTGTVRWYGRQGFGFIDAAGADPESDALYFHLSAVHGRVILKAGDVVTFEIVQGLKSLKCIDVRRAVTTTEVFSCPLKSN
jgi:cold shock CspA family protein